jgi:hypothetical protein
MIQGNMAKTNVNHRHRVVCLVLATMASLNVSYGQSADFQIVWVVIGEAASSGARAAARAGRQLFKGSDLVARSLDETRVSRVQVQPEVSELTAGDRLCITDLRILASGPDQSPIGGAPMSISIRQDHKDRLQVQRRSDDICFTPTEAGEYPIRLNSLLPAPDGTLRGAQFFMRVTVPAPP